MGRECCRADTGTLSIRIHQRASQVHAGPPARHPRPGAPRQGREQPGPAAPRPWAVRIWRLFVIHHAAPDTRIPAVMCGCAVDGERDGGRAERGDLVALAHADDLASRVRSYRRSSLVKRASSPAVLGERILHPLSKDQGARRRHCFAMRASEERAVIIRVFRPTIHPGKESEFESFLRDTAAPLVSRQAGLVAQHVGRSHDPSSVSTCTLRFGRMSSRSGRSLASAGRMP